MPTGREVYEAAQMVVKVKEPQPWSFPWIRPGQVVFGFFHFAADRILRSNSSPPRQLLWLMKPSRMIAADFSLLAPMSEVAGRMSIQQGAKHLERPPGGRGAAGRCPGCGPSQGAGFSAEVLWA